MEALLLQPGLKFGEERHDVADLVMASMLTGDWQELERAVELGLVLEAEHEGAVGAQDVEQALKVFRYERKLLAAAELRAWLEERGVSVRDLRGVLRRGLLRERFTTRPSVAVSAPQVAAVMRAEAICGGVLLRCAELLRSWHAGRDAVEVSQNAGPEAAAVEALAETAVADVPAGLASLEASDLRARAARLLALRDDFERFRATAVSEETLLARLEEHRVDWTVVSGSELGFEREGAALETRLHVLHDGRPLAAVAEMLGIESTRRVLELQQGAELIGAELLAARRGDLVGPWNEDERWRVLELEQRVEPDPADESLRARASEELLGELVERLAAGRAVELAAL